MTDTTIRGIGREVSELTGDEHFEGQDGDGSFKVNAQNFRSYVTNGIPDPRTIVNLRGMQGMSSYSLTDAYDIAQVYLGYTNTSSVQLTQVTNLNTLELPPSTQNLSIDTTNLNSLDLSGQSDLVYVAISNPGPNVSTLDFSAAINLLNVAIDNCNIISLYMSGKSSLATVTLTNLPLIQSITLLATHTTTLTVSGLPNLAVLTCSSQPNGFTSIGLTTLTALQDLDLSNNHGLTSVNLSSNPALTNLALNGCALTSVNLSVNTNLIGIHLDNNSTLTSFTLPTTTTVQSLSLSGTPTTSINVTGYPNLTQLEMAGCNLSVIDVSYNHQLTNLGLSNNHSLTTVDITNNPLLLRVDLGGCALTQSAVDNILLRLVASGLSNGQYFLWFGTNAAPSATGLAAKATLTSRGWTGGTN